MGFNDKRFRGNYASIGAKGDIRVKAEEDTPGAQRRDYELKDGTKGTKWELIYSEMYGYIREISFREGDFGTTCNVLFEDSEGEKTMLNISMNSNFAEDFLKKLPNVDFTKEVTIKPYAFTARDTGKLKKGVTLLQIKDGAETKIENFFVDPVDKKKTLHGFPETKDGGKGYTKSQWNIYFLQTKEFLQKYTKDEVIPNIPESLVEVAPGVSVEGKDVTEEAAIEGAPEEADDEIKVDDMQFDEDKK